MKHITSVAIAFVFFSLFAWSSPTSLNLTKPAAGDSYKVGRSITLAWDTIGTTGSTFRFYWAESQSGPWTLLPLPKGATEFLDSDGKTPPKAIGTVKTVLPYKATTSLYVKMEYKDNPTVFDINGPITVTMPQASKVDSVITGTIGGAVTLSASKIYGLRGVVFVLDGGILKIQPGTIILGEVGAASAICINRGGKIYAEGTPEKPIVMTSGARPGQRDRGDWGGLLLMGRAKCNVGDGEAAIEGGIADDNKTNGWYGGSNDDDNSGVIKYVRIEFAGIAESPDNELNGLTLGAVGRGTEIHHVQVSYGGDDSYEWFGGSVNCHHMIAFGGIDDDFDTDNGYSGKIQFGLGKRFVDVADQSNSEAFESDNDSKSSEKQPFTRPVFSNMTLIGPISDTSMAPGLGSNQWNPKYLTAIQIRRNSRLSCFNTVIVGWPRGVEITDNPTVRVATQDSIAIRNCSFFGIKDEGRFFYFGSNTSASGNVTKDWLKTTGYDNEFINGSGNTGNVAQLDDAFGTASFFDPSPLPNAQYINTASFNAVANIPINDPFFEKVNYRGAFGMQRWDMPWAEYDPANKEYTEVEDDLPTKVIKDIDISISPAPAKDFARVSYKLLKPANITIKMLDALGSLSAEFVSNELQDEGQYEFGINTSNIADGIYFIQITSAEFCVVKPVIVAK